jgi:hypothetical protein
VSGRLIRPPAWTIALSMCTVLLAVVVPMALTSTPAAAKTAPPKVSMMGTWTGHREKLANDDGYANGPATLTVTEASGLTFKGTMNIPLPSGDINDPLVGAFTPNGALMAGGDQEGFYSFARVNTTTLDYCYVEAGDRYIAVCGRLKKQK